MSKSRKEKHHAAATELQQRAEEAINYLEHMRVEHGCPATLTAIDDAAALVSARHKVAHSDDAVEGREKRVAGLRDRLVEVAELGTANIGEAFVATMDAALHLTDEIA